MKPKDAAKIFEHLDGGVTVDEKAGRTPYDVVVLFAKDEATLKRHLPAALSAGAAGATLWIAYPKQSSGRATTLTRDAGWECTRRPDLVDVTMIAFDATWSGVKFRITR